jgi:hypothetical protein
LAQRQDPVQVVQLEVVAVLLAQTELVVTRAQAVALVLQVEGEVAEPTVAEIL